MRTVDLVSSLDQNLGWADQGVEVIPLVPSGFDGIRAFRSLRHHKTPVNAQFKVEAGTTVVGLRVKGCSIIQSHRLGSSHLIREGSVYLLGEGVYSTIFGRGECETLFLIADKSLSPSLSVWQETLNGQFCRSHVNLESPQIANFIHDTTNGGFVGSYFALAAVLFELLDQLRPDSIQTKAYYGLPTQESQFAGLCYDVMVKPAEDWTTAGAAERSGYSVYHFSRTFRQKHGIGFNEYVARVRCTQAVMLMCDKGLTSTMAIDQVGFGDRVSANRTLIREIGFSFADIERVLSVKIYRKAVVSG